MILKCKMCGASLSIKENNTICTCDYCGTTQTIPKLDNDKIIRLFSRANDYRFNNEFDKAFNAYETIISENPNEAEAYWGLVLSEYGVEYVTDPATSKKVPTCHRTKTQSVTSNANYKKAIELVNGENKLLYEEEASVIDSIQKKILSVSKRMEPYDVFICYKETDDNTKERTVDSVLAQDIYKELSKEGFKVFFSRITLEDKLGVDYEPYIYSALTSSRVMLLVTTSNEHCNAVWVKNEWSRFISFSNDNLEKILIPVIKDMDPYELPDELQRYQSQDMNKIGAMQDLIYSVSKLINRGKTGFTKNNKSEQNVSSLLIRAKTYLEVGDFENSISYCQRVLDIDSKNIEAYKAIILAENKSTSLDQLVQRNMQFLNSKTFKMLSSLNTDESNALVLDFKKRLYSAVGSTIDKPHTIEEYKHLQTVFESLGQYEQSEKYVTECKEKITQYYSKKKKKSILISVVTISLAIIICGLLYMWKNILVPQNKYNQALELYENSKYEDSIVIFEELAGYKESNEYILMARHNLADLQFSRKQYKDAMKNYQLSLEVEDSGYYYKYLDATLNNELSDALYIYKTLPEDFLDVKERSQWIEEHYSLCKGNVASTYYYSTNNYIKSSCTTYNGVDHITITINFDWYENGDFKRSKYYNSQINNFESANHRFTIVFNDGENGKVIMKSKPEYVVELEDIYGNTIYLH